MRKAAMVAVATQEPLEEQFSEKLDDGYSRHTEPNLQIQVRV